MLVKCNTTIKHYIHSVLIYVFSMLIILSEALKTPVLSVSHSTFYTKYNDIWELSFVIHVGNTSSIILAMANNVTAMLLSSSGRHGL